MRKPYLFACFVAATLALNVAALLQLHTGKPASLTLGNTGDCQEYRIGSIATRGEVAAMFADARQGALDSGCVTITVEEER